MIKKIRELNNKEIKFLKSSIEGAKNAKKRTVIKFVSLCALTLILGLIAFYFHKDSKIELKLLLIVTILIYISIIFWVFIKHYIAIKLHVDEIKFAIQKNEVISIHIETTKCIELSEESDEGNFFLFQLLGNKIILLGGQEFEITQKFPNDNFEIAVCYDRKERILFHKIYTYGNKLLPIKKIIGEKKQKILYYKGYSDFSEFQSVNGHINNIDEIFDL